MPSSRCSPPKPAAYLSVFYFPSNQSVTMQESERETERAGSSDPSENRSGRRGFRERILPITDMSQGVIASKKLAAHRALFRCFGPQECINMWCDASFREVRGGLHGPAEWVSMREQPCLWVAGVSIVWHVECFEESVSYRAGPQDEPDAEYYAGVPEDAGAELLELELDQDIQSIVGSTRCDRELWALAGVYHHQAAEMFGLMMALQIAVNKLSVEPSSSQTRRLTVNTDSQESIWILAKGSSPWAAEREATSTFGDDMERWELHEEANKSFRAHMLARLEELGRLNVFVSFEYVPGHVGVPGNEVADKFAKDAREHGQSHPDWLYNWDGSNPISQQVYKYEG
ncbi:hypothetical protein B0T24DRAFT_588657 [Lasiosphaeria ovina]|uniref:RNase H type-1 domain-containing protein n=1 Tax=Lasiosphaeria ovina TaxID=92902 RepID=A0AAE0NMH4_9PEZI|nr:hypothetical protein B0T24DRAFT_588657 [Lasiosphaeria ovina]